MHHKWQPQKSWTSFQDYRDAQDKQQMQYPLTPRSKWKDAPRLATIPKSECPDEWIRLPRHKWPKSWANIEDPVVLLERKLCGHPLAGLWWESQLEEVLLELGWGKVHIGNVCLFIEDKIYFCQYLWMTSKWLERSRTWLPCGKTSILTNQHHFLTTSLSDVPFRWKPIRTISGGFRN